MIHIVFKMFWGYDHTSPNEWALQHCQHEKASHSLPRFNVWIFKCHFSSSWGFNFLHKWCRTSDHPFISHPIDLFTLLVWSLDTYMWEFMKQVCWNQTYFKKSLSYHLLSCPPTDNRNPFLTMKELMHSSCS